MPIFERIRNGFVHVKNVILDQGVMSFCKLGKLFTEVVALLGSDLGSLQEIKKLGETETRIGEEHGQLVTK